MEDIYKLCDKIVEKRILSKEALIFVLKGISGDFRKTRRYTAKYDKFVSRAYSMNYRAKKVGAKGTVTADELREMWGEKPTCAKCGATKRLVFDHIKPFYKGGTNERSNLQILCSRCNMEKGVN